MASKHEHKDCDHELSYCKLCDVVECLKCGREWSHRQYYTVSTSTYTPESGTQFDYTTTPHEHTC